MASQRRRRRHAVDKSSNGILHKCSISNSQSQLLKQIFDHHDDGTTSFFSHILAVTDSAVEVMSHLVTLFRCN